MTTTTTTTTTGGHLFQQKQNQIRKFSDEENKQRHIKQGTKPKTFFIDYHASPSKI